MKKTPFLKVKQLRLIGIAILVVVAAILVPILQRRCDDAEAPATRPPTAYFTRAWVRCLSAQELEERDGVLYDSRLEKRMGSISQEEGERELDRIEIHIPYLLYEKPKPEGELELQLLMQSNEARETIGRAVEALYRFADGGERTLNPQPEALFPQILDTMRGGKKVTWVWFGLYCTAEQHMDMLGKTTLVLTAQRMAAWDTPVPTK